MEHKTRTKALSWLLSLAMLFSLVPGMSMTAMADSEVSYQEGSWSNNSVTYTAKKAVNPTTLTNNTTAWGDGNWYVVPAGGVEISTRITVTGTANLILTDGNTLTASKGITVAGDNTLNIFAQSEGNSAGELLINNVDSSYAGIGGISYRDNGMTSSNGGSVNIHGGKITVAGGSGAAGIGGGFGANGGTVTIYGGAVTATGGDGGAGIGGGKLYEGNGGNGGTVTIYGGTVTARGDSSYGGTGIGVSCDNYGNSGNAGTVIINGGTVTATGGYSSAGICSGTGEVIINGGTVSATGGDGGAGIGGGAGSNGGIVTINGGTVTATGGNGGAGIGSGRLDMGNDSSGIGGSVTINGGTVTATGGAERCMGIGGVLRRDQMNHTQLPPKNGSLSVGSGLKVYGGSSENPTTELTQFSTIYSDDYNETTVYRYMIVSAPLHTHDFTYAADGATITATCANTDQKCTLDDGTEQHNHTATLTIKPPANLVYDGKAKAATVENNINNNELTIIYTKNNAEVNAADVKEIGYYAASVTLGGQTASVIFEIKDNTYTIIIPATLDVENAGWNATAGITAYGEIAEDKKLTVTATSANNWALTKAGQQETIAYKLAESGDSTTTYAGATEKTVWDFSVTDLAGNGTTKTMGAVVEEYINKPAGDYTDTVTFTAEVKSLLNSITIGGVNSTELIYADGDTWAQIVDRNPGKIYIHGTQIWRGQDIVLYVGSSPVNINEPINPSATYKFEAD